MRQFLLTLFFACQVFAGIAQTNTIDSQKQLMQTTKKDTARGRILVEMSHRFMNLNSDSSLLYAQQAYSIAKESGYSLLELNSLNAIANAFYATGNYSKARQ